MTHSQGGYKYRLPVQPLLDYLSFQHGIAPNSATVSRALGVSPRSYARWLASGEIALLIADDLCCRVLSVHPHTVWGDAWWMGTELDEREDEGEEIAA